MPRKIIYLINPISGTKKKAQVKDLIIRKTRAEGIDFEILPSKADGSYDHLQKLIKKDAYHGCGDLQGGWYSQCGCRCFAGHSGKYWNSSHGFR